MHSMNVNKEHAATVKQMLTDAGISFEAYEDPEAYSVFSFVEKMPLELAKKISPLCVQGGKHWGSVDEFSGWLSSEEWKPFKNQQHE